MQVARLWNQYGAYCREWFGENLKITFPLLEEGLSAQQSPNVLRLWDGEKPKAEMILNGHSLVIEDVPNPEGAPL